MNVADHLRDRPALVKDLYRRFVEIVAACGPYHVSVAKTAITFKGPRRGFAGAKPKAASLDGYFDLQRRVKDPRILRSSPYGTRLFVHQFRVIDSAQLDSGFARWIREAYAVGCGQHLGAKVTGVHRRRPKGRV